MNKKQIEEWKRNRSRQRVRDSAYGLSEMIEDHKVMFDEDMWEEILDYLKEKRGGLKL